MAWLQVLRRTIQFFVLFLLIAIPTLSHYENLRNQRDSVGIAASAHTRLVDAIVGDMEDPARVTTLVRGSVWTFKAGPLIISDPLAGVDFAAASRELFDPFLWTILLPLLASILLGRVFCGWICPADLIFEAGSVARRWIGIETDVGFSRLTKFVVLALGIVAGGWLGTQVFAEIYPPRLVSGELYLLLTFGAIGAGAWFLVVVTTFEIFVSRRFWCRYVCPGGALYSLLGRHRILRMKVNRATCTSCGLCDRLCEFGLEPAEGRFGQECNNCGLCTRGCAHGALTWRLGRRPADGIDAIGRADRKVEVS